MFFPLNKYFTISGEVFKTNDERKSRKINQQTFKNENFKKKYSKNKLMSRKKYVKMGTHKLFCKNESKVVS